MEFLAADLRSMIATAAPVGPVVLIGHSMGGMAILSLAAHDPDLFAERVAGIGLVCTGATYLRSSELNRLLATGGNPLVGPSPMSPPGTRRSSSAAGPAAGTRCGCSPGASASPARTCPAAMVDYLDEMISGTPVEVIAEFTPALFAHDQIAACRRWPASRRRSSAATRTG